MGDFKPETEAETGGWQPPYTPEQLQQYVDHIKLPAKYHLSANPPLDHSLLRALHIHQISSLPYENLDLHYSSHHSISLDPAILFSKIICRGADGRGGYCMELSLLFMWILRAYGFDVYPTGVHIRLRENGVPSGDFIGLVHIVLIITLSTGEKYISDVAFGGDGMTTPQLLVENAPVTNLGTQENRYILSTLPQNPPRKYSEPQKYWIWQYRNSPTNDWNSFYCFTETEFLVSDFDVMNWFTSQGKTFQRVLVLVIKFLRDEREGKEEARIAGKVMLVGNVVKRNMGGKTEVVQVCESEAERIEALRKWFGIELTEEERAGIKGLVTELTEKVVTA